MVLFTCACNKRMLSIKITGCSKSIHAAEAYIYNYTIKEKCFLVSFTKTTGLIKHIKGFCNEVLLNHPNV